MRHAPSIRLRACFAVLLSFVCASSVRAQTSAQTPSSQNAALPMPMRIGPTNRPVAPKANVAQPAHVPIHLPATASSRGPLPSAAHPNASSATVNPIAFAIAPYAEDGTFVNYGFGESQYGAYIAVEGDFDHKNGLDVVTVQTDGSFNLILNDGKGNFTNSFQVPATLATYTNATQGFAADLNGDGYLDIIASTSYPIAGFMVWINNGNGTFAAPVVYAIPTAADPGSAYIGGIAVGDVNGDGKQDVVFLAFVAAPGGDPVSPMYAFTFLGQGDGTFPSASVITNRTQLFTPNGGLDLGTAALADMNGDGKLDLVAGIVNTNNSTTGISAQYISISLGDGTGNFAAFSADTANVEVSAPWTLGQQIQVLDLNRDGKPDVLWTDSYNTVYTSLGNGDGTLQAPITAVYADAGASALTTGDFNQDGLADVAVFTDGLTAIYAGAGDGTFAATPLAQYPNELRANEPPVAQDFDGDGIVDLIAVRPFFNQLAFLKGYGNGTFQSESVLLPSNTTVGGPNASEPAENITVLTTGKWNASGYPGVLAEEDIDGTFYLDLGIGDGHGGLSFTRALNAAQVSAHGLQAVEPIAADFNGDGLQDVVWTTGTGVAISLSKGDGTFSSIVSTNFPSGFECPLGFADAADLNGDGKTDLVIAYSGDAACNFNNPVLPSGFFVLLGDGAGHFTATFEVAGESIYKVKIASLKNDGVVDIVLDDQGPITPAIYSIAPTSPGVYTGTPTTIWRPGSVLADLLVQDLNGDGIPDLTLLQVGLPTSEFTQPGVLTLFGKGDGTFQTLQFDYVGIAAGVSLQSADFNQDGLPDLAVAFGSGGGFAVNGVAVFANLGNGAFGPPVVLPAPLNLEQPYGYLKANNQIFTGDFNADGAPDVLLAEGGGYVPGVLYFNQAGTSLQLVAGAASIPQYSPVTFTVLASGLGSTPPTGSVSFSSNGTSIGSATFANGSASLTVSSLPVGNDTIVAKYGGSSTNYPATSNTAVVTVTALAPEFTLTAASSTLSVASGTPASTTLSLASNKSFLGSVSFTCEGLPVATSCSFTPASVSLAAGKTASVTVSVSYSNQAANAVPHAGGQTVMALCGMFFLFCAIPGKRRGTRGCVLALLIAAGAIAGLSGCAGSPAKKPAFTANLTVLATGVSGAATVSQSVPLQVAIQP